MHLCGTKCYCFHTLEVFNVGAKIRKVFDNLKIIRKKVMIGGKR